MPRKSKKIPTLHVFADTETENGFEGQSIAATWLYAVDGLIDNTPYIAEGYNCINEMLDHIVKKGQGYKVVIIIHNIAYDLMRFKAQASDYYVKATLVGGQFVFGVIESKVRSFKAQLRDSYRAIPGSLKKLSTAFAPDYTKLDYDISNGYVIGDYEAQEYAKQDVISLAHVYYNYASEIGVHPEKLSMTAAGQAFKLAKESFVNAYAKDYYAITEKTNRHILDNYYFGGRIYIPNHYNISTISDVVSLDITSSYPHQMTKLLPLPGIEPKRLYTLPKSGLYLIKIKVHNYYADLPILPVRDNGSPLYPHGTFETHLTKEEYEYYLGQTNKGNHEILEILWWHENQCANWLKPFVMKYYELKNKGDLLNKEHDGSGEALRTLAKLMLNSPYGKFAQKYIDENDNSNSIEWNVDHKLDAEVKDKSIPDHRNAYISTFITGYARTQLYKAISYYGSQNVLYSDTDSIKVIKSVYDTNPKMDDENDELGGWKNEGEYNGFVLIAPKVYAGITKKGIDVKCKGITLNNYEAVTINGIKQHLKKGLDKILYDAMINGSSVIVHYGYRPVKLKSFVKNSGQYATKVLRSMTKPSMVKSYIYNDNCYKVVTIQ